MDKKALWWQTMIKKHGSEEAARRFIAEGGRRGGLAQVPKGVAKLTPERRAEISRMGVQARQLRRKENQ